MPARFEATSAIIGSTVSDIDVAQLRGSQVRINNGESSTAREPRAPRFNLPNFNLTIALG